MPEMNLTPEAASVIGAYRDADGEAWWIWEGSVAPEPHTIRPANVVEAEILNNDETRSKMFTLAVTVDDPPRQTIGYVLRAFFIPDAQTVSPETVSEPTPTLAGEIERRGLTPLLDAWDDLDGAFWQMVESAPDPEAAVAVDDPIGQQIRFNLDMLQAHTAYALNLAGAMLQAGLAPLADYWVPGNIGDPIGAAAAGVDAIGMIHEKYPHVHAFYMVAKPKLDAIVEDEAKAVERNTQRG